MKLSGIHSVNLPSADTHWSCYCWPQIRREEFVFPRIEWWIVLFMLQTRNALDNLDLVIKEEETNQGNVAPLQVEKRTDQVVTLNLL